MIPVDMGGGSPISKTFLMSYIMLMYDLKNYVEIGVYRGRSFFPMALTTKMTGGMAYGVDAYDNEVAKEYDLDSVVQSQVTDFIEQTNFSQIYKDVIKLQEKLELTENSEIIKDKSSTAIDYFRSNNISIDMLHVDGNHDTLCVMEDVNLYLPLINKGGFIVLDDIDWNSVKPVFDKLNSKFNLVFSNGLFAIFSIGNLFKRKVSIFQKRRLRNLHNLIENSKLEISLNAPVEVAIIDDVFPHPLSAFRMQEFTSYLKNFDDIKIYSSGSSISILGKESLSELTYNFNRIYPEFAIKVEILQQRTIFKTKLIYTVFLGNAYRFIDAIEKANVPFIFTLYPGGQFGINNPKSDMMLKRVTSSRNFRKIIVTQKITYDYLIKRQFCTPEQVEYIFGVVTPLNQINIEYSKKSNFGIDKNILDICFVAFKYTENGADKGYDIFIDVAKKLGRKYDNIHFHVVGGFDENTINVDEIKEMISFYGKRDMEWFDQFYKDKDIILSPNAPSRIFDGSFDGFPTASCVDAGIRKTAIFCTDELSLNTQFVDGEELVIIHHNAPQIVSVIENYYNNPQKLKALAENGCRKIKKLYSYNAQILPRINIINKELVSIKDHKKVVITTMSLSQRLGHQIFTLLSNLSKFIPPWGKNIIKKMDYALRSNKSIFNFVKKFVPEYFVAIYRKLKQP